MATLSDIERPHRQTPQRSTWAEFIHQVRTLRSQRWGNLWGYVFVAPALILYFVFQAWPIIRGFYMAFSDYRWIMPETHGWSSFNGADNFVEMWGDTTFWRSLGIAFKFTIVFIPATLLLSLFVAVMISKVKNPTAAGFYRVISYLPVILPVSVSMVVWRSIYHTDFGYLNHFLKTVVGIPKPPNWLGSSTWALWSAEPGNGDRKKNSRTLTGSSRLMIQRRRRISMSRICRDCAPAESSWGFTAKAMWR